MNDDTLRKESVVAYSIFVEDLRKSLVLAKLIVPQVAK
jgi:hypothetical protein